MIGSGIPISHNKAPLPNPIVLSSERFDLPINRYPKIWFPLRNIFLRDRWPDGTKIRARLSTALGNVWKPLCGERGYDPNRSTSCADLVSLWA